MANQLAAADIKDILSEIRGNVRTIKNIVNNSTGYTRKLAKAAKWKAALATLT
jgi:hypothetical protein